MNSFCMHLPKDILYHILSFDDRFVIKNGVLQKNHRIERNRIDTLQQLLHTKHLDIESGWTGTDQYVYFVTLSFTNQKFYTIYYCNDNDNDNYRKYLFTSTAYIFETDSPNN